MTDSPGEKLIDSLDELRQQLNLLVDRLARSGVERTNGLRVYMGRDCEFFKKSLDIFVRKDYIDLRNLIESCHELFQIVEGRKNSG